MLSAENVSDHESSSSREERLRTYDYRDPISATVSTISQSSGKGVYKIGDEPRFDNMSVHKIYEYDNIEDTYDERNFKMSRNDSGCMKLKFLIPYLPSYLVTPFPN